MNPTEGGGNFREGRRSGLPNCSKRRGEKKIGVSRKNRGDLGLEGFQAKGKLHEVLPASSSGVTRKTRLLTDTGRTIRLLWRAYKQGKGEVKVPSGPLIDRG